MRIHLGKSGVTHLTARNLSLSVEVRREHHCSCSWSLKMRAANRSADLRFTSEAILGRYNISVPMPRIAILFVGGVEDLSQGAQVQAESTAFESYRLPTHAVSHCSMARVVTTMKHRVRFLYTVYVNARHLPLQTVAYYFELITA